MVYHFPGTEPWGNHPVLGPLRLITCDEQGMGLLHMLPKAVLKTGLTIFGIASIIKYIKWPESCLKLYKEKCDNSVLKNVTIAVIGFGVYKFFNYIITKWSTHMTPRDGGKKFFFAEDEKGRPPADVNEHGCVLYQKSKARWVAYPYSKEEAVIERAFNTIGMHFWRFIHMELTVGFEYPMTALFRVFMHYMTPFDIKWTYNQKADRKQMYLGCLNTTLVCFVNNDEKDKLRYGNVCLKNLTIPYNQESNRTFDELIIELDHTHWELASCTTIYTRLDGVVEVQKFGCFDNTQNTYKNLSVEQQLHQCALLAEIAIALYSHSAIHWWANGVGAITPEAWKSKPYSDDITQWMNSQAVFLAWLFFGNSEAAAANLLCANSSNGINFHGGPGYMTPMQKMLGDRSMFHQVSSRVRKALADYTGSQRDEKSLTLEKPEIDGILAATMMHNLDHYCCAKFFPLFAAGSCIAMKSDIGGLIMTLVKPITYWTRMLLVKQNKWNDPISQIIYDTCLAYEKELPAPYAPGTITEFANYALAVGCAF